MDGAEARDEACSVRLLSAAGGPRSDRSSVAEGRRSGYPRGWDDARPDVEPESRSSTRSDRHFTYRGLEDHFDEVQGGGDGRWSCTEPRAELGCHRNGDPSPCNGAALGWPFPDTQSRHTWRLSRARRSKCCNRVAGNGAFLRGSSLSAH